MQKDQNLGSFTLGPVWINPLELSNVAATLASHGKWCPPTPIDSIVDREGRPVPPLTQQACEQVIDPGLADTLSNGLSKDDLPRWHGVGRGRGRRVEAADVRQDRDHRIAHVVGIHRVHQQPGRQRLRIRGTHRPLDRFAPAHSARVGTATCSAAPSRPAPGSRR